VIKIEDLKAKSEANKELNDKKRLATSYANVERSRYRFSGRDSTRYFALKIREQRDMQISEQFLRM